MNTLEMDPIFTAALRDVLVATVEDTHRARRRWRWRVGTGIFLGATFVAGGVALASGVFSPPGATVNSTLGSVVSDTRTGTATINIGTPPPTASGVSLTLTCLTVGSFYFPDGSSMSCDAADFDNAPPMDRQASEIVPLGDGVDAVTIESSPSASWTLQATYVNQVATSWGVNASGETYGVPDKNGTPDLVAVIADEPSVRGYVKESELNCAAGGDVSSPAEAQEWDQVSENLNVSVPVYESDGETVIGTFTVGSASGPDAKTAPLSSLSLGC